MMFTVFFLVPSEDQGNEKANISFDLKLVD